MTRIILFFLLAVFTSCSGPYLDKDLFGADEFVMDSYRIREGKFAILEMRGECIPELDECFLEEYQDRIHEDDVLQIALYHPKRSDVVQAVQYIGTTVGYRVTNGQISLPDLPPVAVANLTLEEARQKIQGHYQKHIEETEVFIGYKDRIARKVELMGLVGLSSVPVDGKIRLFDVLSKARVPVEANLFKSYIIRDNEMLSVDIQKLIKEGDMEQNIVMQGGR